MRTTDQRSGDPEWLVTNGLGGYAFGSVAGFPTRSYHGLLIVAQRPPVERTVLVTGLLETVSVSGSPAIALNGVRRVDLRLDGRQVVARFDLAGVTVERRVWMAHERDTTYVRYDLLAGADALELTVVPLLTERDHHAVRRHRPDDPPPAGVRLLIDGQDVPLLTAGVVPIQLREEAARGLPDQTDALLGPTVVIHLTAERPVTLTLTAEAATGGLAESGADALAAVRERDLTLLARAGATTASAFVQRLVLAADAFLVRREIDGIPDARSIIAGYPWFNDWGRDTMIALPGLCLATGRHDEAATILRSFARFVRDGLLPNDFPDDASAPAYHTIDASLWFVRAVRSTVAATGDRGLLTELLPAVRAILDAHLAGTRFGIGADPADGLLCGGAPGVQLTWMDAKVDDWVVTPRRGKPVEIQALWVDALRAGSAWTNDQRYDRAARRAVGSFQTRFWRPELGYLADVVDGEDGDDLALRPNQILALTLDDPIVTPDVARSVLAAVREQLAVQLGLRSLARNDPAYRSTFQGDRQARDGAYHQGTVWTWLIGPYADAVAHWDGGPAAARAVLAPFKAHLGEAGLGSVSEILEPEPPFTPRGCPFQAWGVAEVLRAWRAYGGN